MQTTNKAYKDFTTGLSIRTQKVLIVAGGSLAAVMAIAGTWILFLH